MSQSGPRVTFGYLEQRTILPLISQISGFAQMKQSGRPVGAQGVCRFIYI
jgi:hypothetical protein